MNSSDSRTPASAEQLGLGPAVRSSRMRLAHGLDESRGVLERIPCDQIVDGGAHQCGERLELRAGGEVGAPTIACAARAA